jgi:4-amino-4-deoxy-L-arabinose transferase-like glycosyltransferase
MNSISPSPQRSSSQQRGLLFLLLLFAFVWFGNLEYRKLVRPDEGRYAEIPREMAVSGDWTTPRLNGIKYFEKPALQYWATAAAYETFGEHHWTARLWPALTGFLGVLFAWYAGSRLFGREAGLYAAAVLGSSLLYVLIGHLNTLDMGVSFFMGAGLMAFLLAQKEDASAQENRSWMLAVWASLAFSVLSKGLMGVVLPGAALVIYTFIHRDFALWKRLHLLSGFLLFLAITVPWFVAVSLANPEFFHFFFIHEHFERFLTKTHGRYHPWWNFLPILAAGILPWFVPMLDSLARAWNTGSRGFNPQRFLLIWAVFIFVFFSASSSKLPSYILPIFPALALLIGKRLSEINGKTLAWQMLPMLALALVCAMLAPQVTRFADVEVPIELYEAYSKWLLTAAVIWFCANAIGIYLGYRGKVAAAIITFAAGGLIAGQLVLTGHDSLSPSNSAYHLVEKIRPQLKSDAPFYSVGVYEQTLPFYIKRTVTLVAYEDELAFGIKQEPEKQIPDMATFEKLWRVQPYAMAIMTPDTFRDLAKNHLPMREIARDTRRVIVTNKP